MGNIASGVSAERTVGIVQPTYLPWLPFFERMARSDVFVYLDDVQYSKNSFHNRNAIKGQDGRVLLTVPVLHSGHRGAFISEIRIDNRSNWGLKHWRTVQANYARAPFYSAHAAELEAMFTAPAETLLGAVLPFIEFLRRELGIVTPCHLASSLNATGTRNEKLVNICKALNGTHFFVKPGTEDYHPASDFVPYGIALKPLEYTPLRYPQLHGEFASGLSALDFILNNAPGSFLEMLGMDAVRATA